ncbi:MAG: zinc metallopeptidase [Pseudomonadota bacterium]
MILWGTVLILAVVFGPHLWAKRVLGRYDSVEYFSGNGMTLARLLLDRLGLGAVRVEAAAGGDHYDPALKVVRLSPQRCSRRSLTAVVVAAHEVGHALQDNLHYPPLAVRNRMVAAAARMERFGAAIILVMPLVAALTRIPAAGLLLAAAGFATLCLPVAVHLLTLPTEFDASFNRALPMLTAGGYIPPEDIPAARKILLACALTYVATALMSLLNVWRWIRILKR